MQCRARNGRTGPADPMTMPGRSAHSARLHRRWASRPRFQSPRPADESIHQCRCLLPKGPRMPPAQLRIHHQSRPESAPDPRGCALVRRQSAPWRSPWRTHPCWSCPGSRCRRRAAVARLWSHRADASPPESGSQQWSARPSLPARPSMPAARRQAAQAAHPGRCARQSPAPAQAPSRP